MNYDIYVITLERSKQRWDNFKNKIEESKLQYNKFDGIDGNNLNNNTIRNITTPMCYTLCSNSMIGCAASHIHLWKKISESDKQFAIVFEDDANIEFNNLSNIVKMIEPHINKYGMIYLHYSIYDRDSKGIINKLDDTYSLIQVNSVLALTAYIIYKDCAYALTNYFRYNRISYHIDSQLNIVFDDIYIPRAVLEPPIATTDGTSTSTMTDHNSKFIKYLSKSILYYTLTFPICSIFGRYTINIYTVFIISLIIFLIVTKIRHPIVWFFIGMLIIDIC